VPFDLQDIEEEGRGRIPAHSHLMGAWVQAGILGAVFWAYVFWLALKSVFRLAMLRPGTAPVYMWILVGFIWDVLFSPFGATQRTLAALAIVLTMDLLEPQSSGHGVLKQPHRGGWRRMPARERLQLSRRNQNSPSSGTLLIPGPNEP